MLKCLADISSSRLVRETSESLLVEMVENNQCVVESETSKTVIGDFAVSENEGTGSEEPCVAGHSERREGTGPENAGSGMTMSANNESSEIAEGIDLHHNSDNSENSADLKKQIAEIANREKEGMFPLVPSHCQCALDPLVAEELNEWGLKMSYV